MRLDIASQWRSLFRENTDLGLSSSGVPMETLLHAELFSMDQLDKHGESLAHTHEIENKPGQDRLLARLDRNEIKLKQTYELLYKCEQSKVRLTPAGTWLVDNYYLIQEQIETARAHLPKQYSQELPRLKTGSSAGYPRVYDIIRELISHVDGRVDEGNLSVIINAYQRISVLSLGELWAIPIMLRLALIDNLRRVASRIEAGYKDRDLADFWADKMLDTIEKDPKNIILDLADMSRAGISLSTTFVAELIRKLQGQNPGLILPVTWIEQRLAEQGQTIERQIQMESQLQAISQISISNSIGSLRFLLAMNWKAFVETTSRVDKILGDDPADVYRRMDFNTRDRYRHAVEKMARQSKFSEVEIASKAVEMASKNSRESLKESHVGHYLIGRGTLELGKRIKQRFGLRDIIGMLSVKVSLFLYLFPMLIISALCTYGISHLLGFPLTGKKILVLALSFLVFSQMALSLVNWIATMLVPPKPLPRMDFSEAIPDEFRTLVTVPTLLSSSANVRDLLNKIEVCYLANKMENLYFSLLTDFKDAPEEKMSDDDDLLEQMREGIKDLNRKYNVQGVHPFFLFHRKRTWNPKEKSWMGYERKRGKLEELNEALRSDSQPEMLLEGNFSLLGRVRFVITLDTDTQMPRGIARKLVETLAHPLNRPVFSEKKQRVVDGYTILQPRVVSSLPAAGKSWYSRMFGSDAGIDPYTREVSDVYQDVFREGSFIGKGIYDVDMFTKAIGKRLPENSILSHDLLEGTLGRSALVSDLQFVEDFPERYSEDISRQHRWIRGDWQILAWLFPWVPGFKKLFRKNPTSLVSRWKIFDNLRRSLIAPAMLTLIGACWIWDVPSWIGLSVVISVIFLPFLPGTILSLFRNPKKFPVTLHLLSWAESFIRQVFQSVFKIVVLPYEAFFNLDAVLRTCWRMFITRRKLLEWTTSGEAKRKASSTWGSFHKLMVAAPLFVFFLLGYFQYTGKLFTIDQVAFLLVWLFSPTLAWLVSTPFPKKKPILLQKQVRFLRRISRKTWRFFETFVCDEDNWLPPDNFQEAPVEAIAHRTSPTNIGLMLLSNLGAYDLGYITAGQVIDKCKKTLKTMGTMPRYKGHFYNWYDTLTLEPLPPHYISTVDSGNLMGFLHTLGQGLLSLKGEKVFQQRAYRGLSDTLLVISKLPAFSPKGLDKNQHDKIMLAEWLSHIIKMVENHLDNPADLGETIKNLDVLIGEIRELRSAVKSSPDLELDWWFRAFETECIAQQDDLCFVAPWVLTFRDNADVVGQDLKNKLLQNRTLSEIAGMMDVVPQIRNLKKQIQDDSSDRKNRTLEILSCLEHQVRQGVHRAAARCGQLEELSLMCKKFADQDLGFLYEKSRNLFAIGYDVSKHRRDEGFYDLLASEARLASFVGVAQGKIPVEHWFSMGRLVSIKNGKMVLLSWGGSMFEYLMPRIVLPSYENTLLDQTLHGVVERQISYGTDRGVPWGISESGENTTDASLNYQYRSFGVPGLGFKHGLASDLVIAPYASMLALMVKPEEACSNLMRMGKRGYEGRFGFYEAIDFTAGRLAPQETEAVIRSFMVHHQAMGFLSFVNFFTDDIMPRRLGSDPLFESALLLLQERVPKTASFNLHASEVERSQFVLEGQEDLLRVFTTARTLFPEVHLLSNGRYHVMVTNSGGGYSKWRDIAVTRWRDDQTLDSYGTFIYMRDVENDTRWSATFHPVRVESKYYEAVFPQARAEFKRRDAGIDTYTEIAVSPEDDIENRRITLGNYTMKQREIELTSYAEIILLPLVQDAAHPAFSNLFMQTEILKEKHAILCSRRSRSPGERNPWMFHLFTSERQGEYDVSFETDRLKFIGRGRTVERPRALDSNSSLSNTAGAVLDPIVSIRSRIILEPGSSVTVSFISGMAETREQALALIDRYQDRRLADRVFDLASIHGKVILQQLNATEADAQLYGRLASSILYPSIYRRAHPSILIKNHRGQSDLWAYAISGDLPIVILRISDIAKVDLAAKMIQAHAYWRMKGLEVDLVIWNEDWSGYRQELNDRISGLIAASTEASVYDRPGGIFVRHSEQMSEEDRVLIQSVASVVLTDNGGSLVEQIQQYSRNEINVPRLPAVRDSSETIYADYFQQKDLLFFNGWGGFTRDGREYIIHIKPDNPPPMPWVNVLANKRFGTVVSQSGAYSWVENAHEYRITPWYNDPITDAVGEILYLRNESTGKFWSATPLPCPAKSDYLNRHGFGYSVFECFEDNLKTELWNYVDVEAPVKFWLLKARNDSTSARRFSTTLFLELVLGESRTRTQMHVRTSIDSKTGALLAINPYNTEFPGRVVFLETSEATRSVTGDRTEFLGRNGSLSNPAALRRTRLSGRVGPGFDPAVAMQVQFELEAGQEKEIVFILGSGRNLVDAQELVRQFRGVMQAYQARDRVWQFWNRTLGSVNVDTPDDSFNMLANGWLLYQTMASRFWGRSGYYQSGGAFGFRDQLQDVMAFLHSKPELTRSHLLLSASRQFKDGDVQHWWHPPHGRGVRTRISDDYLWLPLVTSFYVDKIGDTGILDEVVPFLDGRPVNLGEESYYDLPVHSDERVSLYEHCKRAITNGLRFGVHGLPLMGSGDWNDGMNHVGIEGKGESVWLAFFLYHVLERFENISRLRKDDDFTRVCETERVMLRKNIEEHGWDGAWYRRAYFDDGNVLGSKTNDECKIDAIAQSWAVISGAADPDRALQALHSLEEYLIQPEKGIISLLQPPFDKTSLEPGYIKGYVPGVRENGGQYTHAAVWAVMAFAQKGEAGKVDTLLQLINPIHHSDTLEKAETYKVEPYVMAADVYGVNPHVGRGGWTWYTGSASWMYRLMVESVLGIDLRVDRLYLKPCLPPSWEKFKIHYMFKDTLYHLDISQKVPNGIPRFILDGVALSEPFLPLIEDHVEHFVEVFLE